MRPKRRGPKPRKPALRKIRGKGYILVDPQIVSWQAKRRAAKKAAALADPHNIVHKQFKSKNPPKRIRNIFNLE